MTHVSWVTKMIHYVKSSIEKFGSPCKSFQRCTNHAWNIFARDFTYYVMELLFSSNHGFHHTTITFASFNKNIHLIFDKNHILISKFLTWMKLPWIVYQQVRCRYPPAWRESATVPYKSLHLWIHIKIVDHI